MRIVLTTFGSLGDLYPYLAIGRGLKARGHDPVIATSAGYGARVREHGLGFHPVRPDLPDAETVRAEMRHIMDEERGSETVITRWMMPALRDSLADTLAAAEGADLLVSHLLTFATPLAAELRGIPWVSTALQPVVFFSVHDPPLFPQTGLFARRRWLGPWFWRPYRRLTNRIMRPWFAPLAALRAELGLPPLASPPLIDGASPYLGLALFSPVLAKRQPDWPPRTETTGFPFLDAPGEGDLPAELEAFLTAGPPPLVFTLGSAAVMNPGTFYEASIEAAARLRQRAVLLVGNDPAALERFRSPDVLPVDYAPHAALFPRAAANVHQGGIGTTGQAMRAGKPMLVVPFAHDQPDNAYRLARLGISRTIARNSYTAESAARELRRQLDDADVGRRAGEVGRTIRAEDGEGAACDAIEALLRR